MIRLRSLTLPIAAAALLAFASQASAQNNNLHKLTRLGAVAASAMHVPPLTNAASLKRLMANPRMAADFRKGFDQAGLGALADAAIGTLTNPTSIIQADDCISATAPDVNLADGALVECKVAPGSGLDWMMYRKRMGKRREVALFQGVEWAGKKPFGAFAFRIVRKDGPITRTYQFVLPKPCSNLSLLHVTEVTEHVAQPHALTPSVKSTCDCANGKLTALVSVGGDTAGLLRVRVAVDGNPVGVLTAPGWQLNTDRPGTYTFQAEGAEGASYAFTPSTIHVDACAGPSKVTQTCSIKLSHVDGKKGIDFTIDATGTTSGSPNVPATTVVQLYGPTGTAIGQPITLTGDMKTTVTVPYKKSEGNYRVTSTVSSPDTVADCKQYGGKDNCEATDIVTVPPSTSSIFVDGVFGKERRQRPASEYRHPRSDRRDAPGRRRVRPVLAAARRQGGLREALQERLGGGR